MSDDSADELERLWRMKLELDIIEECNGEPVDFETLWSGFVDEDGDSTSSREEVQELLDGLVSRGLIKVAPGKTPIYRITPEGGRYLKANWPSDSED